MWTSMGYFFYKTKTIKFFETENRHSSWRQLFAFPLGRFLFEEWDDSVQFNFKRLSWLLKESLQSPSAQKLPVTSHSTQNKPESSRDGKTKSSGWLPFLLIILILPSSIVDWYSAPVPVNGLCLFSYNWVLWQGRAWLFSWACCSLLEPQHHVSPSRSGLTPSCCRRTIAAASISARLLSQPNIPNQPSHCHSFSQSHLLGYCMVILDCFPPGST